MRRLQLLTRLPIALAGGFYGSSVNGGTWWELGVWAAVVLAGTFLMYPPDGRE